MSWKRTKSEIKSELVLYLHLAGGQKHDSLQILFFCGPTGESGPAAKKTNTSVAKGHSAFYLQTALLSESHHSGGESSKQRYKNIMNSYSPVFHSLSGDVLSLLNNNLPFFTVANSCPIVSFPFICSRVPHKAI